MAEKNLQAVSRERIAEAVRNYGLQKQLALDLHLSDADLSRLLNDHMPKLLVVLAKLDMEVVDSIYLGSLKRVLKESL